MHRPNIDWEKNNRIDIDGSIENKVFSATQKLIAIRKKLKVVADQSNLTWLTPHNMHVAGYLRTDGERKLYCICNFSNAAAYLTWYAFKEHGNFATKLYDHWSEQEFKIGFDHEHLIIEPYGFYLFEAVM
jgi:amylosucrase